MQPTDINPITTLKTVFESEVLVHLIFSSSIDIAKDTPNIIAGIQTNIDASRNVSLSPINEIIMCEFPCNLSNGLAHFVYEFEYQSIGGVFHYSKSKLK